MYWQKLLLVSALSAGLTACGASSSSPDAPGEPQQGALPPVSSDSDASEEDLAPAGALACAGSPEKWEQFHDLRIYQVMTEAFIDGNPERDMNVSWGNSAHRGDIEGIRQSLDYIANTLNMNAIWLTPVFRMEELEAGQDVFADRLDGTGYFASNYFQIDPRFGTIDELRDLVDEAHSLGLYVFLDGVFGHFKENADQFPSPEGETLSTTGPEQAGVGREAQYPEDLAFYEEVIEFWTREVRIDGWRLDQANQVPTQYWNELRNTVQEVSGEVTYTNAEGEEVNPLGYMVAEVFEPNPGNIATAVYGSDNSPTLCSAFDFPLHFSMRDVFTQQDPSVTPLRQSFNLTESLTPGHAIPNTFLGNHDVPRFGDVLQRNDIEPDQASYYDRHRLAYTFMAGTSGPMTLYYGEEIGDEVDGFVGPADPNTCGEEGRYCEDHVARNDGKIEGLAVQSTGDTFQADAQQQQLRNFVADLMQLREQTPELRRGERTSIDPPASLNDQIYIDHKAYDDSSALLMLNVSDQEQSVNLVGENIASLGTLEELVLDEAVFEPSEDGLYTVTMPAVSARILNITEPDPDGLPEDDVGSGNLTGEGPLAACDTPDSDEPAPIGEPMFIRGTFAGGGSFGETPRDRQFSFKGDNLFQVVVNEPEATSYTFKFANSDFSYEFAVQDSADVIVGTEQVLAAAIGPGTESFIEIPEPGDYVFSFQLDEETAANGFGEEAGGLMMVSKCPEE